jgi:hypothetical protein
VVKSALPPADDDGVEDFLALGDEPAAPEAHPILSAEEVDLARKKARERLDKERRAAAMRQVEDQETDRLRREEGLTSGITDEDKIVWVTIDLPDWCLCIAVNGGAYHHGHSYQVPKHVQRTLAEQMQNAWRANDLSEGKSIGQQFQSRRNTNIDGKSGIVDRAPTRFDNVN